MGKFKTRYKSITGTSLVEIAVYFIGFFFSVSLGSFYVTLSERILLYFYGKRRKGLSTLKKWKIILFTSSNCQVCGSKIPFIYLIPVFGYLITQGKCFHCKNRISIFYPLSELLFGCWFCFTFLLSGSLGFGIFSTFLFGHVFLSMMTDVKKYILDYENLPFITLFYFLSNLYIQEFYFIFGFENFLIGGTFFLVYVLIYKFFPNQMGFGDVLYVTCYSFLLSHPFWMFFLNIAYLSAVGVYFFKKLYFYQNNKKIPMGFYFGISFLFCLILKFLLYLT